MSIRHSATLMLIATLASCGPPPQESAPKSAKAIPAVAPEVTRIETSLPAQFAAELPSSPQQMSDWLKGSDAYPPSSYVIGAIAYGDAEMFERWAAAAAKVDAADAQAWSVGWYELLQYRGLGAGFCALAEPVVEGQASTFRMAVVGSFDEQCSATRAGGTTADEPVSSATDARRTERETMAVRLRELGFARVDAKRVGDEEAFADGVGAEAMLVEAGHAHWLDVETGTFPNEHDALLRALAELVHPALAGVVFEEVAPDIDEEGGRYLLRAYVDGQRLETVAEDLGDWYDVDAVLRLLEATLDEREAPERLLLLATEDQTAIVVGGTPEVLHRAIEAGLLEPGDADQAQAIGKAFEARVLQTIQARED